LEFDCNADINTGEGAVIDDCTVGIIDIAGDGYMPVFIIIDAGIG
jgi:hypothetical protein